MRAPDEAGFFCPKALGVYIHIPFCLRKCLYCDFLSGPADLRVQERYVNALCREIREESTKYRGYRVETVFLGGGTPSLLKGEQIQRILGTLYGCYHMAGRCEISMEMNPGTADWEKLTVFRKAGVNRLSIGLQSASDDELKALGRIHSSEDFFHAYRLAAEAGFTNINVDLMTGIPGQTPESCQDTLEKVVNLKPAPVHISAYSLIIEEGTPFYESTPPLPGEEEERKLHEMTRDFLRGQGYFRYEISNYAKPGFACRHNQIYWQRGDYAGFGTGAASLIDNVSFTNSRNLESYLNNERKRTDCQHLSLSEQMEEFMFLGLRMTEGISSRQFLKNFGKTIDQVYPGIIDKFCGQGLLQRRISHKDGEWISLTDFGMDVSNYVMAEFLFT